MFVSIFFTWAECLSQPKKDVNHHEQQHGHKHWSQYCHLDNRYFTKRSWHIIQHTFRYDFPFRYQTQHIHSDPHHKVQQFQHWKHSVFEVLLSLYNHTDQEHFNQNKQNVLHFIVVDEVTMYETVKYAFDTLEDQFVEILVLDVLLFLQFLLALLFGVFSVEFDGWDEDLTQSQ